LHPRRLALQVVLLVLRWVWGLALVRPVAALKKAGLLQVIGALLLVWVQSLALPRCLPLCES
jgi:hypothetical protein